MITTLKSYIAILMMYRNFLTCNIRCKILVTRKYSYKTPKKYFSTTTLERLLGTKKLELKKFLQEENFIYSDSEKMILTQKALLLGAKLYHCNDGEWIIWPEKIIAYPTLYKRFIH